MANLTSNALFVVSALVLVVGLLLLAYPYLTLASLALCGVGYAYYGLSSAWHEHYAYLTSVLWPAACGTGLGLGLQDRSESFAASASNLLGGVDLPSPIPHVHGGIETAKSRARSPADEIVSSTPRSSPSPSKLGHGAAPAPQHLHQLQMQMRPSPEMVATDSRQLNFGRISTPKTSRVQLQQPQELHHLNRVEVGSNQKLRNRAGGSKTVQTTAGPLLPPARYGPAFDAGIFVNVNSPGFTDRLVRCANDNTGFHWGQSGLSTQQDRYNSVGLFPIVHLNSHSPPSLSARNSQKAPNSTVRVRIAPPVVPEQRQHCLRGSNIQARSYIPTREALRRNEMAKSVLESLQEASRKRIYSQCQDVLDDESGKKRQRKGDAALPNPNCDIYQYRHIRAPQVPSSMAMTSQNDTHHQGKRSHDEFSRASEPKRQRHLAKSHSSNNEISSSLSSSKTLLQQLSGNKRKADRENSDDGRGKHFKDASTAASASSNSHWLQSRPCDEGESAARTQEVVRSQKKNTEDPSLSTAGKSVQKRVVTERVDQSTEHTNTETAMPEKVSEPVESNLASKLFRKDVAFRSHPKASVPEKRGSSWTQLPPEADERCLLEQESLSNIDRPERFQSLLSRMCGQDLQSPKQTEHPVSQIVIEPSTTAATSTETVKKSFSATSTSAPLTSSTTVPSPLSIALTSSATAVVSSEFSNFAKPLSSSVPPVVPAPSLTSSLAVTSLPQMINFSGFSSSSEVANTALKEKNNSGEKEDQPDGSSSENPSVKNTVSTSSAAVMFNFNPPSSQNQLLSLAGQTSSATSVTSSTSSANPVSFSQPVFKLSTSTLGGTSESDSLKLAQSKSSNVAVANSLPSGGFSFLTGQIKSASVPSSDSAGKSSGAVGDSVPPQKPQLSFGTGTSTMVQQQPNLNGSTSVAAPTASAVPVQTAPASSLIPAASSTIAESKNSFGGFHFSGSASPMFGQPVSTSSALFSFSSPSSTINTGLVKAAGVANSPISSITSGVVVESKTTTRSGSITFGTVSTASVQSPKPSFSFSAPVGNSTTADASKASFTFGANANTNSTSVGFSSPSQGMFNGFGPGPSPSAATSFGVTLQTKPPSQNSGGFSFGSSTSQPTSTLNFGTGTPSSPSVFGDASAQPQSFGTSTTTGFSMQSSVPTFSSSPFGSATTSPFGSSLPSSAPFGGQPVMNNPPAFSLSSPNPPTFGSNSNTSGVASPPAFGLSQTSAEPSFGASSSLVPSAPINSAFGFGAPTDKPPSNPTFNFGGNSVVPTVQSFSFGSNEPQQPNNGSALFQFGQAAGTSPATNFQFGSPSAQPGSGSFSIGSGPSTPQRSRALQNRRRRI
ncbi:hypothetical protein ONE63_001987 [Megalurothrips usitatus]|uniref:Nuclear pore complex protein DDB_G0274915-like n=1 Tax=Megalurothrips usitatus TaxID=439358 RepID=A0AAV7XE31_9NEOP|nr:hypothetical protein ONE63_001987 [Megalurothrips usitatus]